MTPAAMDTGRRVYLRLLGDDHYVTGLTENPHKLLAGLGGHWSRRAPETAGVVEVVDLDAFVAERRASSQAAWEARVYGKPQATLKRAGGSVREIAA